MEVKAALMGEDYEKLKNWQREAYHKQMIGGFKETKEADDGFRKAQKPWAKKLKEVGPAGLRVFCLRQTSSYKARQRTINDSAFALGDAPFFVHQCAREHVRGSICTPFPVVVSEGGVTRRW